MNVPPPNPNRLAPGTVVYIRAVVRWVEPEVDRGHCPGIPPIAVSPCDREGKATAQAWHYFEESEVITKAEAVGELRRALR